MWETWFDPWVGKIPWRRAWQPTPVFSPGESSWTEESGGLQSMGWQRVGHDWETKHNAAQCCEWELPSSPSCSPHPPSPQSPKESSLLILEAFELPVSFLSMLLTHTPIPILSVSCHLRKAVGTSGKCTGCGTRWIWVWILHLLLTSYVALSMLLNLPEAWLIQLWKPFILR